MHDRSAVKDTNRNQSADGVNLGDLPFGGPESLTSFTYSGCQKKLEVGSF
jgi:hypothetical protein